MCKAGTLTCCMTDFSPHSFSVYSVLSEFTLALLEDSGWYQVNYAMANRTINDEPIPLLYGKGRSGGVQYVCGCVGFEWI